MLVVDREISHGEGTDRRSSRVPGLSAVFRNWKGWLIGVALLLAGTLSFLYWAGKKEVWFCDEIYTYGSANGFEQAWPAENVDEWMTKEEMHAFFAADSEYLSLNEITVRLYSDHVPLYFWLFRIFSFFLFKGSATIWIGFSINLICYLLTLGFVYALFWYLTGKALPAACFSLLTCVTNRLMVEQATFLRMYMMLLWMELLLLAAGLRILREADRGKLSFRAALFLYLVSVAGFLTHYDYWIFYAATAAMFCAWLFFSALGKYQKKMWTSWEFRHMLAWIGNFVAALLTTIYLFPYCRWNLNRDKGNTALRSLFLFSAEKADHISWGYQQLSIAIFGDILLVPAGLGILFGCIAGGAVLLHRKKEIEKLRGMALTVAIAQIYQFVVCFTLPDAREKRYLWGAFTLMLLCMAQSVAWLLQEWFGRIRDGKAHMAAGVIAAVMAGVLLLGEIRIMDDGRGVAYLFYPDKDVSVLQEYSGVPWVVYGPTVGVYSYYDWTIPDRICFLTQERTPEDAAAVGQLKEKDEFVLYIYADYLSEALTFFEQELGKELTAQYLAKSTNLTVYLVAEK